MSQFPTAAFTFAAPRLSITAESSGSEECREGSSTARDNASTASSTLASDIPLPVRLPAVAFASRNPDGEANERTLNDNPFIHTLATTDAAHISAHNMQMLLGQQEPTEAEVGHPLRYPDSRYVNCDYNIHNSLGAVFAKSLHEDREAGHVQGKI
jgi:hypothetical protein